MTALITTIQEVIDNGVKVNNINDDSSVADMIAAQLMFIEPVLGDELYNRLCNSPQEFDKLLPYVKKALAPLAYWLELANIQTQITDRSLSTFQSSNGDAAHRWEYEEVKENLEVKGCFYLEQLIKFLSIPQNTQDYRWIIPDEYNLVFKTGIDFNKCFTIYQPFRTFFNLRPFVEAIQDKYLKPTIGEDFFDELRNADLPADKTSWSNDQKKQSKAFELLKKAAANLTIAKSVDMLPVKISAKGFTVSLRDATDKPNPQEQQAPDVQLYNLKKEALRDGEDYLLQLSMFLDANASDALFATYKNSSFYTPPAAPADDINSTLKMFIL